MQQEPADNNNNPESGEAMLRELRSAKNSKAKLRILKKYVEEGIRIAEICAETTDSVVVLVGRTGDGKSVLHNYLLGNRFRELTLGEIRRYDIPRQQPGLRLVELDNTVQIHGTSPIGHEKTAKTSLPIIGKVGDLAICDCPGFNDNRDAYVRLANAANIRNILRYAKSVRIVFVIDYNQLTQQRQTELDATGSSVDGFFGGENASTNFEQEDCVLLAITKVPVVVKEEGEEEIEDVSDQMKLQDRLKLSKSSAIRRAATKPLLMFDPLNREGKRFVAGPILKRDQLLATIRQAGQFRISSNVLAFHLSLTAEDRETIREIGAEVKSHISKHLSKGSLIKAARYFQLIKSFDALQHREMQTAIEISRQEIKQYCEKWEKRVEKFRKMKSMKMAVNDMHEFMKAIDDDINYAKKLNDLEKKYKNVIILREIGIAVAAVAGCIGVGAVTACSIIFPPFIPLEIAGGLAIGGSVAGVSAVGAITTLVCNQVLGKTEEAAISPTEQQPTTSNAADVKMKP